MKISIDLQEILTETYTSLKSIVYKGSNVDSDVLNTAGFTSGDFILIESLGSETAEITTINTVSDPDTIELLLLKHDHPNDTLVTKVLYDQVKIEKSTNSGSSWSAVATLSIVGDQTAAEYIASNVVSTDRFRTRFYSSVTNAYSEYSNIISARGETISNILAIAKRRLKAEGDSSIEDIDLFEALADADMKIIQEILLQNKDYLQEEFTIDIQSDVADYALDTSIIGVRRIDVKLSSTETSYSESTKIDDDYPVFANMAREYRSHYLFFDNATKTWKLRLKETPTENVTDGIRYIAIVAPQRIQDVTDELNTPNPESYAHVLLDYILFVGYTDFRKETALGDRYYEKFRDGMMDIVRMVNMMDDSQMEDQGDNILNTLYTPYR